MSLCNRTFELLSASATEFHWRLVVIFWAADYVFRQPPRMGKFGKGFKPCERRSDCKGFESRAGESRLSLLRRDIPSSSLVFQPLLLSIHYG